jgi:hypothetical protein
MTSAAAAEVNALTDKLATIADWKDDLQARMGRTQLIVEAIGLSAERHDELIAEARAFIRVCDALAENVHGSLVDVASASREDEAAA